MITLICTKCKATLEMDDAFAGGVCRCQYCGTIQTVPSHLKASARGAAVGASSQKALYSTKAAAGAGLPSSGLDELANVVASSGLASGLANRTATPQQPDYNARPAVPAAKNKTPLMIGLGALVAVLIGVIVFLVINRGKDPAPTPAANTNTGPGPVPTPSQVNPNKTNESGPNFLGIPLEGGRVVFLLDRGQSSRDVLDPLKAALYQSLESLGADRDFQVMFWTIPASESDKPNPNEFAYPKNGVAKANADRIDECRKTFEDLTTSGRTDIGPVITEAMKRNPQVIVIATAKGINLDDTVVTQVEKARGGKKVAIHTIDLTSTADGKAVLEAIANKSGGKFKHVEPSVLRSW